MPPKKGKAKKQLQRISEDDDDNIQFLDPQYNPDLIQSLLLELQKQIESKCKHIQNDSDFMVTSMQEAFHLELIKLPTQVKKMSLSRFKSEFGESLEAVTRGAIMGGTAKHPSNNTILSSATKSRKPRESLVFQTPMASKAPLSISTSMRNPKEGEKILSENGSPLGNFQTVVKPKGGAVSIIPQTPGIFVPLASGDIIDVESVDIESLSREGKQDALSKLQSMMSNMQSLMSKLESSKV